MELTDEELKAQLADDLIFWGKQGIRGCPVNYEHKAKIAGWYNIAETAKYPDPYFFVEVTDKQYMVNPLQDKELWLCWE